MQSTRIERTQCSQMKYFSLMSYLLYRCHFFKFFFLPHLLPILAVCVSVCVSTETWASSQHYLIRIHSLCWDTAVKKDACLHTVDIADPFQQNGVFFLLPLLINPRLAGSADIPPLVFPPRRYRVFTAAVARLCCYATIYLLLWDLLVPNEKVSEDNLAFCFAHYLMSDDAYLRCKCGYCAAAAAAGRKQQLQVSCCPHGNDAVAVHQGWGQRTKGRIILNETLPSNMFCIWTIIK